MTFEVRLAFLLAFFALWAFLGFLPWLAAAIVRRGRGVILALPLAIAGGAAGGVLVPLAGGDDERGFLLSLAAAFVGGLLASLTGILLQSRPSLPAPPNPEPGTKNQDNGGSGF